MLPWSSHDVEDASRAMNRNVNKTTKGVHKHDLLYRTLGRTSTYLPYLTFGSKRPLVSKGGILRLVTFGNGRPEHRLTWRIEQNYRKVRYLILCLIL